MLFSPLGELTAIPQISAGFYGLLRGGGKKRKREVLKGRGKGRKGTEVTNLPLFSPPLPRNKFLVTAMATVHAVLCKSCGNISVTVI